MVLKYTPTDYSSNKSCKKSAGTFDILLLKTSAVCINSCYPEADYQRSCYIAGFRQGESLVPGSWKMAMN